MNRDDRLKQLNNQKYLSDEELEEKMRLEEELELNHNDVCTNPQHAHGNTSWIKNSKITELPTKKAKRSILGIIIEHFKEKPVTQEEIDELKKKAVKYRLKADIAKSKGQISEIKSKQFDKLMGGLVGDDHRKHDDFRKLFGNTNKEYTK